MAEPIDPEEALYTSVYGMLDEGDVEGAKRLIRERPDRVALSWTAQPPTRDGLYWMWWQIGQGAEARDYYRLVRIDGNWVERFGSFGERLSDLLAGRIQREWYGPLPVEAKPPARDPGSRQRVAVETDWPADGHGGCQARDAAGAKCVMQQKHTGTMHLFCRRHPHAGYCSVDCFEDKKEGQHV